MRRLEAFNEKHIQARKAYELLNKYKVADRHTCDCDLCEEQDTDACPYCIERYTWYTVDDIDGVKMSICDRCKRTYLPSYVANNLHIILDIVRKEGISISYL